MIVSCMQKESQLIITISVCSMVQLLLIEIAWNMLLAHFKSLLIYYMLQ